jgi:hydrogenase expression/formation protein HypD
LEAVELARVNPRRQVIFFGIGFETTTPPNAYALKISKAENLKNFFLLSSHVVVPPALNATLSSNDCTIEGLLAPGHVCTITGYEAYLPLAQKFSVPIVVTGFEPADILEGIYLLTQAIEEKNYSVINQYRRCVKLSGNQTAKDLVMEVFEPCDQTWRGIGTIPSSGLRLKQAYRDFDAKKLLEGQVIDSHESPDCLAGQILVGHKKPFECPAFGTLCNPSHPLGAPMVSSEGSCAVYYHAGRKK